MTYPKENHLSISIKDLYVNENLVLDILVDINLHWKILTLPFFLLRETPYPTPKLALTICNQCFANVKTLRGHQCNSQSKENVRNLQLLTTENTPVKKLDQKMAAKVLREKFGKENKVLIETGGRPLALTKGHVSDVKWSHEDLRNLKISRQFTGRDITSITQCIRIKCGRASVEPGFAQYLKDASKSLKEYFREIQLEVCGGFTSR